MVTQSECDRVSTLTPTASSPLPSPHLPYITPSMFGPRTSTGFRRLPITRMNLLPARCSEGGREASPGAGTPSGAWRGYAAPRGYLSWVAPRWRRSCCCHRFQRCWPSHWPCFLHPWSSSRSTGECRRCIWTRPCAERAHQHGRTCLPGSQLPAAPRTWTPVEDPVP